jgi:hypothetical protein
LSTAHAGLGVQLPLMPSNHNDCQRTFWPSVDGIFLLGKGFLQSDSSAISYITDQVRKQHPHRQWIWCDAPHANLFLLFMLLTQAASAIEGRWLAGRPYIERFAVNGVYLTGNAPPNTPVEQSR